ncbi:hypothetical protein [[Phormidium] sp. ETS-05]|uniref:hypothetical protein n=1 Tax=[Phormidium] sp. ETS-05 TaxID=222819 RepID=UPI0018EEE44F|nr:hypothetical protein [[Phormidium] sp. ETS-05]
MMALTPQPQADIFPGATKNQESEQSTDRLPLDGVIGAPEMADAYDTDSQVHS